MNYKSERKFKLWAYAASHSILVLRSLNNEENYEDGFNIDVEFWGVMYLDIPSIMNGLTISEINSEIPEKLLDIVAPPDAYVFKIESDKVYYIVAANWRAGSNNWIEENRINSPELNYDKILGSFR
ncbi:hypothetical protein [Pseudobacter ginsenosidimutans]|uniref:Uncharacterized protein n=1 Tax=Pseudobacter ginsenosidimutans TaxID=661488 RepID=A0A4Q7N4C9_9BACT|nr:hypothetical protein [Pseudobacter ginsenosidimutans]QEC44394.1 hypothetical protein FSB84_22965 [Pseudobacter ginsenosidimutans]RZS75863.1 hypothetical protein EV199_1738 [Pseudobacter ginsenosidimutans]